jgi:hypothetical protein
LRPDAEQQTGNQKQKIQTNRMERIVNHSSNHWQRIRRFHSKERAVLAGIKHKLSTRARFAAPASRHGGVSAERRKLCGNSDGGFLPKANPPKRVRWKIIAQAIGSTV